MFIYVNFIIHASWWTAVKNVKVKNVIYFYINSSIISEVFLRLKHSLFYFFSLFFFQNHRFNRLVLRTYGNSLHFSCLSQQLFCCLECNEKLFGYVLAFFMYIYVILYKKLLLMAIIKHNYSSLLYYELRVYVCNYIKRSCCYFLSINCV